MDHWSRRQFVQGVGVAGFGLLAGCGPPPWQAQPAPKVYRLGYLGASPLPEPFREGLRELGYVEGQNLVVELRDPGAREEVYRALAAELVALQVDVLVSPGAGTGRGLREATSTIPIVVLGQAGDVISAGLAASLDRPGGNVTGLTAVNRTLRQKRLQLLQETLPTATRIALLRYVQDTPLLADVEDAAVRLGLELQVVEVRGSEELEHAFEVFLRERAEALLVAASPLTVAQRVRVVELAAQSRLPAMYEQAQFVQAGGLMAYAPRGADSARRGAAYVDKILRGAKPADLPIEQPMTFDFVINLKTAQALGLTIPPHVLLQATEVIQ